MSRRSLLVSDNANRKAGTPKYQPLVSYVARSQDAETSHQPALTPVREDASEDNALVSTRERYHTSNVPDVRKNLEKLIAYLEKSGVEKTFLSLNRRLLGLSNLPYNPYPGFLRRTREWAEGFYMFEEPKQKTIQKLTNTTKPTRISAVVASAITTSSRDGVWGVEGLVGAVDPQVGQLYRWLVDSLTPPKETLAVDTDRDYSNQVMLALLGSCAFHHSFYLQPHEVTIRVEYLIAGYDKQTAVRLFAESVANDVLHMDQSHDHVVLGTTLPDVEDNIITRNWSVSTMMDRRSEFVKVIELETLKKHKIVIEGIFRMDEHSDLYNSGKKQYVLSFLQVREGTGEEEGVTAFTDLPLMTLHEGVFINFLHVDSYMAAFAKMMEEDASNKKRRSQRQPSKLNNAHIQTDGFRLGSKISLDPFTPRITKPIKEELQMKVVSFHPQSRLFDAIPSLLLLCLLDKTAYEEELMLELYRIQRSTAARLYRLQKMNLALRGAINKLKQKGQSDIVTSIFRHYRKGISELFDEAHHQRSCDLIEAGQIILSKLDRLLHYDTEAVKMGAKTMLELQRLHGYCLALQLPLTEDALSHSPKLKETLVNLAKMYPNGVPQPKTPIRQRKKQQQPKTKRKETLKVGQGVDNFIHGVEDECISKHDKQVIDVKKNQQKESAPQSVALESVILRYIVDTRQDEVWPSYLIDLLSGSTLPANPYPGLISLLRRAAMSMDVCIENPQKLLNRLLHGAARIEDSQSHVYYLPGADAHDLGGHTWTESDICEMIRDFCVKNFVHLVEDLTIHWAFNEIPTERCKSALALVDSSVFFKLASVCQPFILQDFIQRKGPYRVAMCCGLGGHTPLFGRLMPYLLHIDLEEHCYIRGPDGGADDALHIYAKIVYDHVLSLEEKRKYPVMGLYMGGQAPKHVTEQDKRTIIEQLIQAFTEHQPVFVKIYTVMEWRYVPIKKHFRFHYVNVEETDFQQFFPTDDSSFYKLVFFEGEKAAFHYQYGGPEQKKDPYSMANTKTACNALQRRILLAKERHEWLNVHRELLTRNLITQGSSHVVEAWRMLHSMAGQFEYLISLTASLIDLVWYSKTQPPDTQQEPTKLGALDLQALGRMTSAYRHKMASVCKTQSAMTASCLSEVLKVKVQQVTERLEDTHDLYLKLNSKTIDTLEEVTGTLECLRDVTSYDVHQLCPEADAMLRAIEADAERPPSAIG